MAKIDFNTGWEFQKDGSRETEAVNLPHDAMIHEERDPRCKNGKTTGYYPGGKYWYRKSFYVKPEWEEQQLLLELEGVYQNAQIWLNGEKIAEHPNGYTGFFAELKNLRYGEENEVKILADNSMEPNTRWYSGSGVYRPVWLHVLDKIQIRPEGVQIRTLQIHPNKISVRTESTGKDIRVQILDKDRVLAEGEGKDLVLELPETELWSEENPKLYECCVSVYQEDICMEQKSVSFGIRIITWNRNGLFINGKEVKLRGACIHHDNGVLGAAEFPDAALRRIRILKEAGFNAVRSAHNPCSKAILDACDRLGMYVMDEFSDMWYEHKNRYDYASVFETWYLKDLEAMVRKDISHPSVICYSIGNEVTETKEERGIRLTEEMSSFVRKLDDSRPVTCGINMALNTMHFAGLGVYQPGPDEPQRVPEKKNPKALALLLEQQKNMKNRQGTPELLQDDGGERENGKLVGSEYFNKRMLEMKAQQRMVVTQEIAKVLSEDAYAALDIAGYNYADGRYYLDREEYPDRISVGTETLPVRIYENWQAVKELPYLVGDFMWTGWDYIGEAGVGAFCYDSVGTKEKEYPCILAGSGVIDILGNPRPEVWLNKAVFGLSDKPYLAVEPVTHAGENRLISAWRYSDAIHSWAWNGCEGRKAEVLVYSTACEVELIQNQVFMGRKKTEAGKAKFEVTYSPGTLCAVAYNEQGAETGRDLLLSAGEETVIHAVPETDRLRANGQDLCYLNLGFSDKDGIIKASCNEKMTVEVSGAGTLAGFGNASPYTEERFDDNEHSMYYGRGLAVIRAGLTPGMIKITVRAKGCAPKYIEIPVVGE